jgi:hypothetical protein
MMRAKSKVQGEGNYAASRRYNDDTKKFVRAGKVEQAARDAAPTSDADALQMAAAEAEGKRRAKEEDPALMRPAAQIQTTPAGTSGVPGSSTKTRMAPKLARKP